LPLDIRAKYTQSIPPAIEWEDVRFPFKENPVFLKTTVAGCMILGLMTLSAAQAMAARAAAPQLLPHNTLVFVRVADVPDTVERLKQTGMGRMLLDPQMQPLVRDAWSAVKDAFTQVQERIDMSLDELLSIPQREIAVGLFEVPDRAEPGFALILDCGDNLKTAQKLFDKVKELAAIDGRRIEEQTVDGTKVTVFYRGNRPGEHVFERDSTFAVCADLESAKAVLAHWTGYDDGGLSENAKYMAIMKASRPARDDEPQVTWYVDPLGIADRIAQGNAGARIGLAILPAIGLDGLQAVGGSLAFSSAEFDMVNHVHILLAIPRAGVLEAIAMDSGDLTPEKWVPGDVASYMTLYWDFKKTYDEVEKLYDSFRGDGATAEWVKIFIADRIGVDLTTDILPQLSGRVTLTSQIMKPVTPSSAAQLLAIELEDPKAFQTTLEKLVERLPQLNNDLAPEKKTLGSVTYYRIQMPTPSDYQEGDPLPEPAFGIAHGCLMMSDREAFLKNIMAGQNTDGSILAEQLDFKLIASKATRAVGGAKPGLLAFNRPEEGLRYLYDLANAEQTRKRLADAGERNPFFRSLGGVLEKNPLPPFSTLEKYIAPSGAAMTNDETGIHYVSFSLRRK